MFRGPVLAVFCLAAAPAGAEVILACSFPTLPDVVMRFPGPDAGEKTMEVGGRPPAALIEGQGTGRVISASVDGYDLRFAPSVSVLDVDAGGKLLKSEQGRCVTIGGPVSEVALVIQGVDQDPSPQDDAPTATSGLNPTGDWQVSEKASAFDDSRTVAISADSQDVIRGQFGGAGPARLYLRCLENTTSAFIILNDLFLSDIQGFGKVDYRIDTQKAASVSMATSTDNKALGLWSGTKAIPFIKSLMSGERVVFRATPYNESPVEFSFDLTGLETAILPLRAACKW